MATKVEVNTTVVEEQIKTMKELLTNITKTQDRVEAKGAGLAQEGEVSTYSKALAIRTALANLLSCTITFLEDAKDGYIENDTYDAEQIQRYRG